MCYVRAFVCVLFNRIAESIVACDVFALLTAPAGRVMAMWRKQADEIRFSAHIMLSGCGARTRREVHNRPWIVRETYECVYSVEI